MKNYVGVWVDHSGAILVFLGKGEPRVEHVESNVDPRFRLHGGFRSRGKAAGQGVVSENRVEARRENQLEAYYRDIIKRVRVQDGILLLGPGEAKLHLGKEIRKNKELAPKLRATQAADKMTDRQLAAQVKAFFHPAKPS